MLYTALASLLATGALAHPAARSVAADENPFTGRSVFVNQFYAGQLEETFEHFISTNDTENALKTRTAQNIGTFVWAPYINHNEDGVGGLGDLDDAISAARAAQQQGGEEQIVGLVLYNIPDRDCSAGESAGELSGEEGLRRYKDEYVRGWRERLSTAADLSFAVVLEPDALGNMVTNQEIELCAAAKPIQEEGIAYAIQQLQLPNVHLYLDVSHGGWLGWPDNLVLTAEQVDDILRLAGSDAKIRGYASNISNYNPFRVDEPEEYAVDSPSFDEDHYTQGLAVELEKRGLPTRFIIDQGRVHLPGAREEWGEWCNVSPARFGSVDVEGSDHVDALVYIKPPGESDGQCGMEGAPVAGDWFNEYAVMLVENSSLEPADSLERPQEPWHRRS